MRVVVLGGGFIGWLAGWLRPDATVLDWRRTPSSGHAHAPRMMGAMYLHQPLEGLAHRKVVVRTTIDSERATYDLAAAYKQKIGKPYDMDSPTWAEQFPFIDIGFLITDWPDVTVQYEAILSHIDAMKKVVHYSIIGKKQAPLTLEYDVLISAIPLPALLNLMHEPFPSSLEHVPIAIRALASPPDVPVHIRENPHQMYIDYRTDTTPIYRVTDFEGVRYYEWLKHHDATFLGIPTKVIRPGKIFPAPWVPAYLRDLNSLNIYPFGRPGRWSPNELIHESYQDMLEMFRTLGA